MALHTFGTTSATALAAVAFASADLLAPADLAAIAASIADDQDMPVFGTGTTHANTTLDTLVASVGSPSLAAIQIGALVLGVGIVPGTFVSRKPTATSVTLSQAATGNAGGVRIAFVTPGAFGKGAFSFNGQLYVPNRGALKILPGDVVAIDNTGWPILVSAGSVAYAGSLWQFV